MFAISSLSIVVNSYTGISKGYSKHANDRLLHFDDGIQSVAK